VESKKRIRILGWKTPRTPPHAPFGMTMPKGTAYVSAEDVPESATAVFVFDMEQAEPMLMHLKREELANYKIV
jgi:hypothetical protein